MAKSLVALIFMSVALAGVAAGCGSDSDSGEAPTKAVFIKKADVQCDKGNSEQSKAVKVFAEEKPPIPEGMSPEEALITQVVLPHIQENLDRLGEMETPTGDEEKIQAIITANEKGIEETEEEPSKAIGPPKSPKSPFAEGTKLSMAYGFRVCGQY